MASIAGTKPPHGTDIHAIPLPSYISPMGMRPGAMMESGTFKDTVSLSSWPLASCK